MSSIRGEFVGEILAAGFDTMKPEDATGNGYAFGELAGKGWACRISGPVDVFPKEVLDTVQGGSDVPVRVIGEATAEPGRRGSATLKLRATSLRLDVPSNGAASRPPAPTAVPNAKG